MENWEEATKNKPKLVKIYKDNPNPNSADLWTEEEEWNLGDNKRKKKLDLKNNAVVVSTWQFARGVRNNVNLLDVAERWMLLVYLMQTKASEEAAQIPAYYGPSPTTTSGWEEAQDNNCCAFLEEASTPTVLGGDNNLGYIWMRSDSAKC